MSSRKSVLLMIETSLHFGREVLRGINQYLVSHRPWSIWLDQKELMARPPSWFEHWTGDGLIVRSATPELVEQIRRKKIPAVDLTDVIGDQGLPRILVDHEAVGRTAAQHLLERGFRNFAFCGFSGHRWSELRKQGFVSQLPKADDCRVLEHPWHGREETNWDLQQRELIAWLRKLQLPVGILACNDFRGQHLLDACRRANLSVPEEVAVIGVDNDDLICNLCDPPLSSIVLNVHKIGYEAARLLDQLMGGAATPHESLLIPPVGVMVRQSSDVLAIDNSEVARVLRFIRQHACTGLTITGLLAECRLTRSVLERQFRKYLGHSPQQEIRLTQIKRVKELLLETEFSLHQIAGMTGFDHSEYLSVMFKRITGQTPGEYRRTVKTKMTNPGSIFIAAVN